jgi:hypothetical protein
MTFGVICFFPRFFGVSVVATFDVSAPCASKTSARKNLAAALATAPPPPPPPPARAPLTL